jgi:hypothetical protein
LTFWQRPTLFTAAHGSRQPAREIGNGFGADGLPLGMPVLGRPCDDVPGLRAGLTLHDEPWANAWQGCPTRSAWCNVCNVTTAMRTNPANVFRFPASL